MRDFLSPDGVILPVLQPVIEVLLSIFLTVIIPALVAWAWGYIVPKLKLNIEAKHRDALTAAIQSAALVAVQRVGGPAFANTISKEALKAGIDYVKASSPEAIAKLKVPEEMLAERVLSQATAIVQSVPTVQAVTAAVEIASQATQIAAAGASALDAVLRRIGGSVARR